MDLKNAKKQMEEDLKMAKEKIKELKQAETEKQKELKKIKEEEDFEAKIKKGREQMKQELKQIEEKMEMKLKETEEELRNARKNALNDDEIFIAVFFGFCLFIMIYSVAICAIKGEPISRLFSAVGSAVGSLRSSILARLEKRRQIEDAKSSCCCVHKNKAIIFDRVESGLWRRRDNTSDPVKQLDEVVQVVNYHDHSAEKLALFENRISSLEKEVSMKPSRTDICSKNSPPADNDDDLKCSIEPVNNSLAMVWASRPTVIDAGSDFIGSLGLYSIKGCSDLCNKLGELQQHLTRRDDTEAEELVKEAFHMMQQVVQRKEEEEKKAEKSRRWLG